MDPAGGADYCAEQHATEPGTATAADAPTQSAEQAEVERLYSLHDAAARSAATAAALMNMPGCDHHVAAAVAVAQLCEDPAGAVDKHNAAFSALKPEHSTHGGYEAASAAVAAASAPSGSIIHHGNFLSSPSHPPPAQRHRVAGAVLPGPTPLLRRRPLPPPPPSSALTDVSTAASSLEAERAYDFVGSSVVGSSSGTSQQEVPRTSGAQQHAYGESLQGHGRLSGDGSVIGGGGGGIGGGRLYEYGAALGGQVQRTGGGAGAEDEDASGSGAAAARVEVWRLAQVATASGGGDTCDTEQLMPAGGGGGGDAAIHRHPHGHGQRRLLSHPPVSAPPQQQQPLQQHQPPPLLQQQQQQQQHLAFSQGTGVPQLDEFGCDEVSIATARHGPIAKQAAAAEVAVAAVVCNELLMRHGADEEDERACLLASESPKDRRMETPLWADGSGSLNSYGSAIPESSPGSISTYGCATPDPQVSSPALPMSSPASDASLTTGPVPIPFASPSSGHKLVRQASRGCRILPNSPRSSTSFGARSVKWADGCKSDVEGTSPDAGPSAPRSRAPRSPTSSCSSSRSSEDAEVGGSRKAPAQQQQQQQPEAAAAPPGAAAAAQQQLPHLQQHPAPDLITPCSSTASLPFPQPHFGSWSGDGGPVGPYGSDTASRDASAPVAPWRSPSGPPSPASMPFMDLSPALPGRLSLDSTPSVDLDPASAADATTVGSSVSSELWVTAAAELGPPPVRGEIGPAFLAPALSTADSLSSLAQLHTAEIFQSLEHSPSSPKPGRARGSSGDESSVPRPPSPPPTAVSTTFAVAPLQLTVSQLAAHDIIASQAAAAGMLNCLGEPVHEATHTVDMLAASMKGLVTPSSPPGSPNALPHHSSMSAPAAVAAAVACCVPLPIGVMPPAETHGPM
ncbi:MAG: hypothetical protein WDW36_004662 [Sanguina aurantia]